MSYTAYLDHNASAPLRPAARAAAEHALLLFGNASSVHGHGRRVRAAVEEARDSLAALTGLDRDAIVFTSGGSEANNQVIQGLKPRRLIVSAIEHPAVAKVRDDAEAVPVGRDGRVDLDTFASMLADGGQGALVCVMLANNETGVVQPVAEAAEIAHRAGALLHCDAVQAVGKIGFDPAALGADTYALSGHKIGALAGVGALLIANGHAVPEALVRGGGQERNHRAGTENLVGIASFGAAAAEVRAGWRVEAARLAQLRDQLEERIGGEAEIAGRGAARLPNTSNVILAGVDSEKQVMAFDLAGVSVSAGAACSSGKVKRSAVLDAMGYGPVEAGSAVRVSLGWNSTLRDVEAFVDTWSALARRRAAA